eukprot:TRINITY_DN8946_c0_g1_i2.p1 TRINITY_DN8946_c0_g1~~TRINITY_DN8946_c0_g1_i2.p1  ORF type:complete len:127 (-),score=54.46 TRINITY_DN8946_c0_g1_i2:501-881(-)
MDYFYVLTKREKENEREGELIGFINGTLSKGELTHETMANHNKDGDTLCIHSVAVELKERRKGYASFMMKRYVEEMNKKRNQLKSIQLLCKSNLIPFYQSCGFQLIGESKVEHGKEQWFDMIYNIQ